MARSWKAVQGPASPGMSKILLRSLQSPMHPGARSWGSRPTAARSTPAPDLMQRDSFLSDNCPPMGIYETLYKFQDSFGQFMGTEGTHP